MNQVTLGSDFRVLTIRFLIHLTLTHLPIIILKNGNRQNLTLVDMERDRTGGGHLLLDISGDMIRIDTIPDLNHIGNQIPADCSFIMCSQRHQLSNFVPYHTEMI